MFTFSATLIYMPEGHVIHRLAREFTTHFHGSSPAVSSPQGRFSQEAAQVNQQPFVAAHAWGKHLFLEFDGPQPERFIWVHLGLVGSFRWEPVHIGSPGLLVENAAAARDVSSTTIRLRIATATHAASLRGPQWCRLISQDVMQHAISALGADPLRADSDLTAINAIKKKVLRSSRTVASLLMDQKLFAGVGNIYRAESLFRLGISPFRAGKDLSSAQFDALWHDLVFLMHVGVETGRIDTVRYEHMPDVMGRPPRRDDHGGEVYAYRRHGLPCYICRTPIASSHYEGRNLFWCPTCQKDYDVIS